MGRPSLGDQARQHLSLRLRRATIAEIQRRAAASGQTRTAYLERVIEAGFKPAPPAVVERLDAEAAALLAARPQPRQARLLAEVETVEHG